MLHLERVHEENMLFISSACYYMRTLRKVGSIFLDILLRNTRSPSTTPKRRIFEEK
jgi:hypothetical protein